MKVKVKVKAVKRKAKGPGAGHQEPELPRLVSAMMKIAERLESLEKKMDVMMSQRPVSQHTAPRPQHSLAHQAQQTFSSSQTHQAPKQNQNFQPNHNQGHNHNERKLYQIVCADCRKPCEIPFKPSGDRPVYCKECFAARKASRNSQNSQKNNPVSLPPQRMEPRKLKVIPRGLGKVTISEMVPAAAKKRSSRR